MNKFILVTIEEFLQNGGKLEEGRTLYSKNNSWFDKKDLENPIAVSSLELGSFMRYDEKTGCYLLKNASYKSFPVTPIVGYVMIEVTPHFK